MVYHGHGVYQAGDQNIRLEETEQWVLEALVEARAASKDELIRKSGVDDAVRVLKRIKQKHPALGKVIHFPGGKGRGGYSTSIQAVGGE